MVSPLLTGVPLSRAANLFRESPAIPEILYDACKLLILPLFWWMVADQPGFQFNANLEIQPIRHSRPPRPTGESDQSENPGMADANSAESTLLAGD
jgi:hypothetical protein